jgi:hypothetical protein
MFDDPESAIAREKQLKRWRREWKIALIERENSEWCDLAREFVLSPCVIPAVAKRRAGIVCRKRALHSGDDPRSRFARPG